MTHGYLSSVPSNSCSRALQVLAPVVQTLDSAIHPIKIYPVDDAIVFPNTSPLDSDLSGDSAIQRLNNRDLYQRVNLILPAMLLLTQTLCGNNDRVVTKISSFRVNTTSRRGIKRLGISFGSIFFYFPIKVAGSHSLSSRGKSPPPGS